MEKLFVNADKVILYTAKTDFFGTVNTLMVVERSRKKSGF